MNGNTKLTKRVGAYEVLQELGRGGMGDVLLAEHLLLGRKVALKRFRSPLDGEQTIAEERFVREGRALAALAHPNIVNVYDLFEWRGQRYLVLEYIDGMDLSEVVKRGSVPIAVGLEVGLEVSDALQYIHSRGLIHRDVKPANIMISRDGRVKLMDFGIAYEEGAERMTRTGLVVGTPMYLAPEVVVGKEADERSDVYSVGAVLYYVLTGQRLYERASQEQLFSMIALGKYIPLEQTGKHLSKNIRGLIQKCLEKKPERRFQDCGELGDEVAHLLDKEAKNGLIGPSLLSQFIRPYMNKGDSSDSLSNPNKTVDAGELIVRERKRSQSQNASEFKDLEEGNESDVSAGELYNRYVRRPKLSSWFFQLLMVLIVAFVAWFLFEPEIRTLMKLKVS